MAEELAQSSFGHQSALKVRDLVRMMQEVGWVGAVVKNESEQSGAVVLPIVFAQVIGLSRVNVEVMANVPQHRSIDMRKNVRRGVMQRVVEIEQPGSWGLHGGGRKREGRRITLCVAAAFTGLE